LNAGAQLAMMEGADRTYKYVQKVASFFRYNVKKGDETVTIREELSLIDNYIYILNVRFSGDIHYEKNIEEEWLDVPMPSMILQPIVENCVNHGIREMAGEGRIWLSVYEMDGMVCISIGDNGKGMSKDTIDKILGGTYRAQNQTGDSNGVAMDNVIARMRLFTGKEHVLDILSEGEGMGTEFVLYLGDAETSNKEEYDQMD
jgi:sensor histidine kinase YesM